MKEEELPVREDTAPEEEKAQVQELPLREDTAREEEKAQIKEFPD